MGDHLKKVQSGDPLVIPAQTFNAFVDAPIIGPNDNEDEFKNRATAIGVKPIVPDHRGRFAVYLEPVKDGKIAPACVSGVIPCRINVDEVTHLRADIEHDETMLLTGHHGGAEILWKEGGKGVKWALLKVGIAEPLAITFDVKLVQVDGYPGENCEEDCSFKYDIYDIHTGEKLNEDGEPQGPIQSDIRPKKTQMIAATRGTAYWTVKTVGGKPTIAVQLEEAFEEPTPRAQQYVVTGIECEEGSGSGGGMLGHGSGDCCDFTLKYHTSKVCYPPGVKLEDGPTYTVRCGSSSSSSSGSSFGSSGPPSGPPSGSGSPSDSGSSSAPSSSSGSSSMPSSGPPSSGSSQPPQLPPPPTEPGYYQLCVCYDGTVHWSRTGDTSCGSSHSNGSTPPPPPPSSGSSGGSPSLNGSSTGSSESHSSSSPPSGSSASSQPGSSSGGSEASPSSAPPSSGGSESASGGSDGSSTPPDSNGGESSAGSSAPSTPASSSGGNPSGNNSSSSSASGGGSAGSASAGSSSNSSGGSS